MLDIKLGEYDKKTGERTKIKIIFKGKDANALMEDTYELTCLLLSSLFEKLDTEKDNKFKLLDSFLESIKKTCEQEICYGGKK